MIIWNNLTIQDSSHTVTIASGNISGVIDLTASGTVNALHIQASSATLGNLDMAGTTITGPATLPNGSQIAGVLVKNGSDYQLKNISQATITTANITSLNLTNPITLPRGSTIDGITGFPPLTIDEQKIGVQVTIFNAVCAIYIYNASGMSVSFRLSKSGSNEWSVAAEQYVILSIPFNDTKYILQYKTNSMSDWVNVTNTTISFMNSSIVYTQTISNQAYNLSTGVSICSSSTQSFFTILYNIPPSEVPISMIEVLFNQTLYPSFTIVGMQVTRSANAYTPYILTLTKQSN